MLLSIVTGRSPFLSYRWTYLSLFDQPKAQNSTCFNYLPSVAQAQLVPGTPIMAEPVYVPMEPPPPAQPVAPPVNRPTAKEPVKPVGRTVPNKAKRWRKTAAEKSEGEIKWSRILYSLIINPLARFILCPLWVYLLLGAHVVPYKSTDLCVQSATVMTL